MSNTATAPATTQVTRKSAYQRPYKSRSQRREIARRKHDESGDYKFLLRVAGVIGFLLLVALGFAVKGMAERSEVEQAVLEAAQ